VDALNLIITKPSVLKNYNIWFAWGKSICICFSSKRGKKIPYDQTVTVQKHEKTPLIIH